MALRRIFEAVFAGFDEPLTLPRGFASRTRGGSYRRSVCVDCLNYNADGTIQRVVMTSEGVAPAR